MVRGRTGSAGGAPAGICLIVLTTLALGGCNTVAQRSPGQQATSVAFESIDGAPRGVFDRLVQDLNDEAQQRHLAVSSRDSVSAYRVRGYLGAQSSPKQSTVSWIWDVYDHDKQRVIRIAGEEKIAGKHKDAWQAVDDAATRRIARNSVEKLALFLASSGGSPSALAYEAGTSPEESGIFRMSSTAGDRAENQSEETASVPEPTPPVRPQRSAGRSYIPPSEPPSGTN